MTDYENYTCTGCGKEYAIANSLIATAGKLICEKCGEELKKNA